MKALSRVEKACTILETKKEYTVYKLVDINEEVVDCLIHEGILRKLIPMLKSRNEYHYDSMDNRVNILKAVLLDPTTECYLGSLDGNMVDAIIMIHGSSLHFTNIMGSFVLWIDSPYGYTLYRSMLKDMKAMGVPVVEICRYLGKGRYENRHIILREDRPVETIYEG